MKVESDEFMQIKAELYRIIRANYERMSKRKLGKLINDYFPNVDKSVIKEALSQLSE